MKTKNVRACALAAMASLACAAHAEPPPAGDAEPAAASTLFGVAPASDSMLSAACGGYDLGNGLLVSFGISRK